MAVWSLDDAAFHDSIGLPYTETGDTARHDDEVIASINAVVGKNDELWIIGDATDGDFSVLDRIDCDRINLVVGNHDACFYDRSKLVDYLDAFDTVYEDYAVLDDFPGFEGHTVKLCHFPYGEHDYKVTGELPIPTRDTDALVYGHMHYTNFDRWRDEMALHVGWDAWHRPSARRKSGRSSRRGTVRRASRSISRIRNMILSFLRSAVRNAYPAAAVSGNFFRYVLTYIHLSDMSNTRIHIGRVIEDDLENA